VGIISGPGGPAVNAADACEDAGLRVVEFTEETKQKLSKILPEYGTSIKNPVDVGLQVEPVLELKVAEIIGKDPNVDMLFFYLAMLQRKQSKEILKLQREIQKPIVIVTTFEITSSNEALAPAIRMAFPQLKPSSLPRTLKEFYSNGISVFSTEQLAAKALFEMHKYTNLTKKR